MTIKADARVEELAELLAKTSDKEQGHFIDSFVTALKKTCESDYRFGTQMAAIHEKLGSFAKEQIASYWGEQ